MDTKYKYDVALSFAEEDKAIAEQIANSLKAVGLETYFYEFESAENWGDNIFNIIIRRYREQARFALILISKHYVTKRWAGIERQIIQTIPQRENCSYLLPLRLDDTSVEGLSGDVLFKTWNNNPDELALALKKKLASLAETPSTKAESKGKGKGTKKKITIAHVGGDVYQTGSVKKLTINRKGR